MDQLPSALRVQSHGMSLPLFRLGTSDQGVFPDLVSQLVEKSFALEERERAIQPRTQIDRHKTCVLFLDGLYQAYCSRIPNTAIAFPRSPGFYNLSAHNKINDYTYRNVDACYRALVLLGWVTYCPGFVDPKDGNQATTIAPAGDLLERFRAAKTTWQKAIFTGDPIIVRLKEPGGKEWQTLKLPDTAEVKLMREQLVRINDFLGDQAICLNVTNNQLNDLVTRMSRKRYSYQIGAVRRKTGSRILNFAQVGLRRIFAKGRIDRGGRLYGGWWQTIPKDLRRYITINGRPTVEIDFSEMHPSMLYLLSGQIPPDNIYDLGIRRPDDPPYDPEVEPHYSRRKVIKKFISALINDENERHRLPKKSSRTLGMSHEELKGLVVERHPVIGDALGTDTGLYLQLLDSEIACQVMLMLMAKNIVALPIHDSFLVQAEFEPELRYTMQEAFTSVMKSKAQLKDAELPEDAFEHLNRDPVQLVKSIQESYHNDYVLSWRKQHLEPSHPNLSYYPPYRFPDGELS